jgi:hypothetical protein
MDTLRIDDLARLLGRASGRRRFVLGLAVGAVGITARGPGVVAAGKRRRKKVRRNTFGCVDVGGFCNTAGQCCSGVCQGKKGKRRCRAHDTGGCRAGFQDTTCDTEANPGTDVLCTTSAGNEGYCNTTTGNAGFCAYSGGTYPCAKDAECQEIYGPQAACIRCDQETGGTTCAHA